MSVRIDFAQRPDDIYNARKLFIDYAESLGFSLSFQGFEDELEHLHKNTLHLKAVSSLHGMSWIVKVAQVCGF